jgi:hypothetical protein
MYKLLTAFCAKHGLIHILQGTAAQKCYKLQKRAQEEEVLNAALLARAWYNTTAMNNQVEELEAELEAQKTELQVQKSAFDEVRVWNQLVATTG